MKKAVLISVKPEWVEKIFSGEKIMEFRKTIPNCKLPCKYYIYETKKRICTCNVPDLYAYRYGKGKVVGEFTLNYWYKFGFEVEENGVHYVDTNDWQRYFEPKMSIASIKRGCVPLDQLRKYLNGKDGYALYIDDLKKYDQPKELSEFHKYFGNKDYPCDKCEHSYTNREECCIECDLGDYKDCVYAKLTKAPQSWCYVEAK